MFLLLTTSHVWVTGGVATECEGKDGVNLTCKFLEDINSTQTDFSVYFDPDNGSQGNKLMLLFLKSTFSYICDMIGHWLERFGTEVKKQEEAM